MLHQQTTQVDQAHPTSKFKIQKAEVTSEGTHPTSQGRILLKTRLTRKIYRSRAPIKQSQRLAA
jgi:hypothetical protein